MADDLITMEVNGEAIQVASGSMLIEATDHAGATVPRFCYHKKLSIVANCRMCLVEVAHSPKPVPACSTPVTEGMEVWTRSAKTKAAQKAILDFLLINHPLDCPICDQAGECELQDHTTAFGSSRGQFAEIKRVVADKDVGSLITTSMTRCIQCTRCVRFGEEIAGMRELGGFGRGDRLEIGTYIQHALQSELSGNVIDLCPVGALTAKPSRYKARAWEMKAYDSIAMHDCVGSNTQVHVARNEVIRVVARENAAINDCWLSDRDRFSYQGLYNKDRITKPMIKTEGEWQTITWAEALDHTINTLQQFDTDSALALASANSTVEELFLFQKLCSHLQISNIDHRLRQVDFSDQAASPITPWLGMPLAELEQQQAIILVGADPRHDQPLLNHRIRQAVTQHNAKVVALNPYAIEFNYELAQTVVAPSHMASTLAGCVIELYAQQERALPDEVQSLCKGIEPTEEAKALAQQLAQLANTKGVLLLGSLAYQQMNYASLRALSVVITELLNIQLGYIPEHANTVGACLTGVLPHRSEWGEPRSNAGLPMTEALQSAPQHVILMNVEADDVNNPSFFNEVLESAKDVLVISPYLDEALKKVATIILPSALPLETSGTLISADLTWQSFKGVVPPPEESRPAWKILRVLGSRFGIASFDYVNSQEVLADFKYSEYARFKSELSLQYDLPEDLELLSSNGEMQRVGYVPMYRSDAMVRRSPALQEVLVCPEAVQLNPNDAERLGFVANEQVNITQDVVSITLPVLLNEKVPLQCIILPSGTTYSRELGSAFATVQLSKVIV